MNNSRSRSFLLVAIALFATLVLSSCQHAPGKSREAAANQSVGSSDTGNAPLFGRTYNDSIVDLAVASMHFTERLRQEHASEWLTQAYLLSAETVLLNLSNAHTPAFKRCRSPFNEMLDPLYRPSEGDAGFDPLNPAILLESYRPASRPRIFTDGDFVQTGERLDVAIHGRGFFKVQMPDGTFAFTRAGAFKTDSTGRWTTEEGLPLLGGFQPIATGTTSIAIAPNGEVTASGATEKSTYRFNIFTFANPNRLQPLGKNLFQETTQSGPAEVCSPGENGCGDLVQGFYEASNVHAGDELMELLEIQRLSLVHLRRDKARAGL